MAEGSFDDLQLLSHEDLIVEALRKILRTYAELGRRQESTKDFLRSLCEFSVETKIWFILWEGGGAQRFTDIYRIIGCSYTTLANALGELVERGLVRKSGKNYQAVSPEWLLHFSGVNRRKS